MAYNLDFSAWNQMRQAQRDSILQSAQDEADTMLKQQELQNEMWANILQSGSKLADTYAQNEKEKKKKEEMQNLLNSNQPIILFAGGDYGL